MASLGEAVVETSLDLTGINKGVKDGLGKAFKDAAAPASKAAEAATSKAVQGVARKLQTGLSTVGTTVSRIFGSAFRNVQGMLTPFAAQFANIGSTIGRAFSTVGGVISRAFAPVGRIAGRVFGTITGAARGVVSGLQKVFSPVAARIGSAFSKVAGTVSKALAPIGRMMKPIGDRLVRDAKSAASTVGSALKTGLQVVGAAAGIAAGAAIGTALTTGLGRLAAIDNAQAKLRGLGNDAKDVEQIMGDALASVKGTAFGLGEAATTAAGAVAAGIKPGKELEGVLKTTANTAAAAGVSMEEMGSIFNRVAANGKASNAELQQLADRGVPIYQALADQLEITAQEVFDLASEGKIGFAEFEKAASSAAGNVADEMGKTVGGSFANLKASLGRMGANLFEGVFDNLAPVIQTVTTAMGPLEGTFKTLGESLGNTLVPLLEKGTAAVLGLSLAFTDSKTAAETLEGLPDSMKPLTGLIEKFTGYGDKIKKFWDSLSGNAKVAGVIGAVAGAFALFGSAIGPVLGALGPLGGLIGQLLPSLSSLGGLLRVVLGPFGLIVGVLVAAYASSEEFREAVHGLLDAILPLGQTLISALGPILAMLPGLFKMVVSAITPLLTVVVQVASELISALVPVIQTLISSILPPLISIFKAVLPVILGLVPVITQLVETLAGILIPVIESLMPIVSSVFEGIGAVIEAIVPIIEGIVKTIAAIMEGDWGAVWEGVKETVSAAFAFLDTMIEQALQVGKDIIQGLIDGIVSLVSGVGDAISDVANSIIKWFKSILGIASPSKVFQNFGKDILQGLINGIKSLVSSVGNAVTSVGTKMISLFTNAKNKVVNVFNSLVTTVKGAVTRLGSGVRSGISSVVSTITGISGKITSAVSGFGSMLYNAGASIIDGLVNGIRNSVGKVTGAVSNVMQAARNLLPFSPAKEGPFSGRGWSLYSGESIAEALAEGMQKKSGLVHSAALGMADQAASPLSRIQPSMGASGAAPRRVFVDEMGGDNGGGAQVVQNYYGPTTSGGRLQEMDWTLRYATKARSYASAGMATA